MSNFNPRSLVGNDMNPPIPVRCLLNFNPRSLVGNDTGEALAVRCVVISIHVPSWGTTEMYGAGNLTILFQSTFPRGERPISERKKETALYISIHVPSWGTTVWCCEHRLAKCISIHVPSWGTTANFHKYSLFFYAINIIFLLFIIPSLFSLVLFMLLFWFL